MPISSLTGRTLSGDEGQASKGVKEFKKATTDIEKDITEAANTEVKPEKKSE